MRVASAMILLLYCGVVASIAAVNKGGALADDHDGDAALEDDAESLPTVLVEAALERRASERDSVTPVEGQEDITNRMLLKAIKDAFALSGTPKWSDNGVPLQLLLSQINERVMQMGAEIQVLKAQTTTDTHTLLSQISERVTQMGAEIQVLRAQNTVDAQTLSQMGAKVTVLEAQTTADAQTLQNITRQQERAPQGPGASTFVRWGSSTCGNASSLVYSGVVGGGSHDHSGAAVNYLCLTLSPRLSQQAPPAHYALLYGAEYETHDSHRHNKDPVCAVCRAASSTTVMIPGTDTCTPGWRLQYSGFLMAGKYSHPAATEYICVDRALEFSHRGDSNDNGALLHYTKTRCGSLPCTPYVNDKIVTCAVCSK